MFAVIMLPFSRSASIPRPVDDLTNRPNNWALSLCVLPEAKTEIVSEITCSRTSL
jgi:hypothetical protein